MNLEHATVIFLILVFIAAEIYRYLRGTRGVIVSANDSGWGAAVLPVTTVKVKLENGDEITASLNCCTACLGRLNIGDEVTVSAFRDGHVIDLPWFRRSIRNMSLQQNQTHAGPTRVGTGSCSPACTKCSLK